jgi:hypothetical protein
MLASHLLGCFLDHGDVRDRPTIKCEYLFHMYNLDLFNLKHRNTHFVMKHGEVRHELLE